MEPAIDQVAELDCDVAASVLERVGERGEDHGRRVVDDARVALERVAEPVIVIWQEPSRFV
jgi:hypothetical protein